MAPRRRRQIFVGGEIVDVNVDRFGTASDQDGDVYGQLPSGRWVPISEIHPELPDMFKNRDGTYTKGDGSTWEPRIVNGKETLVMIGRATNIVSLSPNDTSRRTRRSKVQ